MGNLNEKLQKRGKARQVVYDHNALVKTLGSYVTQASSKMSGVFEPEEITAEFIKLLQDFPNLERLSFPHHVRYKTSCLDKGGDCIDALHYTQGSCYSMLEDYLQLHPIPILPQLQQLSFASFPIKLHMKILNIYAPQLEALRLLAGEVDVEENFTAMPKLQDLAIDILETDRALVYLNKLTKSPVKILSLFRALDESDQQKDYNVVPLLMGIRDSNMFQKTLKVLQLEFSGSIMWRDDTLPEMNLPVLKTLKLKHCSTVTFARYSQFIFSLCSINRLTIDKAQCVHKKEQGTIVACNRRPSPINCYAVECQYRSELAQSDLWRKLPKLQFFYFRGCGMQKLECQQRITFYKFLKRGKDFMTFFTDPRKSDIWN